jgi:hypothetical protein
LNGNNVPGGSVAKSSTVFATKRRIVRINSNDHGHFVCFKRLLQVGWAADMNNVSITGHI